MINTLLSPSRWEEAVLWLRRERRRENLVRDCYYDDPLHEAATRFAASEEWEETRRLLKEHLPTEVLDLGAGRGIASYAFAQAGCRVTALEPDASSIVGAAAIADLRQTSGCDIEIVRAHGEELPFPDNSYGVVYARAALHHARDLGFFCREAARVLRPGGAFLAVREHVISRRTDLATFQAYHPLHARYGGENAYLVHEYRDAIAAADLRLDQVLGPYETAINYWPLSTEALRQMIAARIAPLVGGTMAHGIVNRMSIVRRLGARLLSRLCTVPGRHYAFLGIKA